MGGRGKVVLVGAGPGDPGLLTLKGKDAIEQADVLVYDRLVSPRLLEYARPMCERIYVGKTPDRHMLPQEQINVLLADKAEAGNMVVRLKGGDPFVFGRGSEEAQVLRARGVDFEFVPGVTSAIAGPEYAGIPVTHRGLASSFSVITGHEDPEKLESSIDWRLLAQQQGTLVFLMGMKNLPLIAANLMENGMSPQMPVGIVQRGTWPDQRVLCSTLDAVADEVVQRGFANPSIIIVGQVVTLHDDLAWLKKGPLAGKTVAVTRARAQASKLTEALEGLGAVVQEHPMILIAPPDNLDALRDAAVAAGTFDWIVFSSVNGVDAFFDALVNAQDICAADVLSARFVAVGPATAHALEAQGVHDALVPVRFDAEGVVECLEGKIAPGQRVLLVQAQQERDVLRAGLQAYGADVTAAPAYQSVPVEEGRASLVEALRAGDLDAMTFTSSSTVSNTICLLGDDAPLLDGVALYSIGPVTSKTMAEHGLACAGQADEATIASLAQLICQDLGGLA
ncbi:MAG: uroporphyrinogen-III C-methyltransferase [Gordonibacter sp.]|uniref:uroporphyrinogen-III C-methyltransferase n=1 Tax=Gordonibacter sp. TaxID=1968902 RepID=UPI002FC75E9C